ncbi:uncharacterized protein [Dermacentor albipictus]|uniref:uncharacterized protein isoform X1 n=1 Tax=Dermacentor albipictus TaxID=60249 RepID=UPI0031FDE4F5
MAMFVTVALFFLLLNAGGLMGRGPGPPEPHSDQLAYTMDVNPVHPYQAPVYYMRSLLGHLEYKPRDINFFLELAREPNGFLDILDNYQHGISMVIQFGNAILALVAIGGMVVVAARWGGYCGGDDFHEITPFSKTTYTVTMSATLFLGAVDFVLAFMLYQSSSDLSASIDALPAVKEMAAKDLAAFVTNTINQQMDVAERKKRRRLEELEDDFQKAFTRFLKARVHSDLMLRNTVNISDCADSAREIGMLFVKDGAHTQGHRLLQTSKSLARVRDYQERLCNLVAARVKKATALDRRKTVQKLRKELHESTQASAQAELKETLNGLDRAFNRLASYGSKTGWWDRFRSTATFGIVPVFFILILFVLVPFAIAAMTQHNFEEEPEERNIRSHVSGVALIYCAFFLYIFVVLALYIALQLFPYGAVGECYLCGAYRQGSFQVLNMLAVRLWPLNERASMFRGIHPSEILSKCSHGDATLADLSVPAEVRQDTDAGHRTTRAPTLDSEPFKLAQRMPAFVVHDRHVAMLPTEDINVTKFITSLRTSLSKERTLSKNTRQKASLFLQKWNRLDLEDATERLAATSYRRMLLTMLPKYYEDYFYGPTIDRHIGNCGPVYNVVDKTMSATCDGFVDSLLAFVFLLVVAAVASILLAVMAAKGGKRNKRGRRRVTRKKKVKKKKKKKKKKDDTEKTSASTLSKAPEPTKTVTPTPPKTASEDAVIRITTTRTGDSPAGSVDQTEFLEIRLPNQQEQPAPMVVQPAKPPTHTVETLHIQIPQQQQVAPVVVPPPPKPQTSTIEIRVPQKLISPKPPQVVAVPAPANRHQVQRMVSLNLAGNLNALGARRSTSQTSLVQVLRRPSGGQLRTLQWPWNFWYPYWGGGGGQPLARAVSLVTESSSSVEVVERARVPAGTVVRRVQSGPLVTRRVVTGSSPYTSVYPYYAYPQPW